MKDITEGTRRMYECKWKRFCMWREVFGGNIDDVGMVHMAVRFLEMLGKDSKSRTNAYIAAIGYFTRKEGGCLDVRHPHIRFLRHKSQKIPQLTVE